MIFSEIPGHKELVNMMRNMVQQDRMPHAILFSEQSGYGALPIALATIQFLFCKTRKALASGDDTWVVKGLFGDEPQSLPTDDSCQVCSSCIKIRNLTHPDFYFIFPINTTQIIEKGKKVSIDAYYELFRNLVKENPYFSEKDLYKAMELDNKLGFIGVNEANWLIDKLSFSSYEGGAKVVLVMFPERMNLDAANKLLKSIEEPTADTYFLMITHDPGKIIQTIKSRCRQIEVPPIDKDTLAAIIADKYHIDSTEAQLWAECSQGSLGRAVELINEEEEEEKEDIESFLQILRFAIDKELTSLIPMAADLAKRGKESQKNFCVNALKILRQLYMLNLGKKDIAYINPSYVQSLEDIAKQLNTEVFKQYYDILNNAIECIQRNVNAKFVFSDLCNAIYQNS